MNTHRYFSTGIYSCEREMYLIHHQANELQGLEWDRLLISLCLSISWWQPQLVVFFHCRPDFRNRARCGRCCHVSSIERRKENQSIETIDWLTRLVVVILVDRIKQQLSAQVIRNLMTTSIASGVQLLPADQWNPKERLINGVEYKFNKRNVTTSFCSFVFSISICRNRSTVQSNLLPNHSFISCQQLTIKKWSDLFQSVFCH